MNLKFSREEKIDILLISISAVTLIASFILSIEYLSWVSIILCGIPIFKECAEGLITEFDIKADLLVTIAIISSIIIGEIFAAGEIATIMAIGGFLEEYTVSKTRNQIKELVNLTPQKATRIRNGKEEIIEVGEIQIGDILKVLPGETIAADGIIKSGETSINQSTLTGEPIPVDKTKGDEVYSGTINQYGSFTMKTTKESKDSSLQRLIKLVESSKPENAKIVRTADKWATIIVILAFTISILTYAFTGDILRSVTVLVVFCPCALVLATPTAIMAAIGNLTKYGVLVKDGGSLEELEKCDELIFDKTGTLTHGNPQVVEVISDRPEEMLKLMASLESKSEHPLAKAVVNYYHGELLEVNDFEMLIGKGVKGKIGEDEVAAGNIKLLENENIPLKFTSGNSHQIEIYFAKNMEVMGKVLLEDRLRENSKNTIKALKRLGINTTLLTGDSEKTGSYIAQEVKVNNSKFNCLPEDKIEYIKIKQKENGKIAMIGDGINDAPSLRKANVGIAMGSIGSDISIDAANITLINDNIGDVPQLMAVARKTVKTINRGITFALALNILAMILAVIAVIGPIEGALIHNIGSVIVIIYASRLINFRISEKDYRSNLG